MASDPLPQFPASSHASPASTRSPTHPMPPLAEITGETNVGAFGALLGRSPFAPRAGLLNNAEIVVWQASRRLTIALTIGIAGILLRVTGVVSGPVWPLLAIVPAYLGVI